MEVIIYPVRVQGKGATEEIAHAIRDFAHAENNGIGPVDVIVVTRGGGSIEDLWAFNEEEIAYALFDSPIPVISAVGHEIDFTIADLVADVRAPTPSAAAEILIADREELRAVLHQQMSRLLRGTMAVLQLNRERLSFFRRSALMRESARTLLEYQQSLDRLITAATAGLQNRMRHLSMRTVYARTILQSRSPVLLLARARESLNRHASRLNELAPAVLQQYRQKLHHLYTLLEAFSPKATLLRGFTITTRSDGSLLHSAIEAVQCSELRIRFSDGEIQVRHKK